MHQTAPPSTSMQVVEVFFMRFLRVAALLSITAVLPTMGQTRSTKAFTGIKGAMLIAATPIPLYNKPLTLHGFYYTSGSIIGAVSPGDVWTIEDKTTVPTFLGTQT